MANFESNTAEAIVAAIIKDGAADAYMSASEDERTEMMLAYMQGQTRKIEQMQVMYQTRNDFRDHFRQAVYGLCLEKV